MIDEEIWKPIPGMIGYEASNLGRARSIPRLVPSKSKSHPNGLFFKGKILKPNTVGTGYLQFFFSNNGKELPRYFHRAVALAFLPNPNNLKEVDHIDGDKKNNRVENLEWVDRNENIRRAWVNGCWKNRKSKSKTLALRD